MKIEEKPFFAVQKTQNHCVPMQNRAMLTHKHDTFSFGKGFPMSLEKTKDLANALTTSTSGVRRIGKEYDEIIEPLTKGVMAYCAENKIKNIVLAHDTREITSKAGKQITKMLVDNGFNVHVSTKGMLTTNSKANHINPVSTPLLATATRHIAQEKGEKTFGILLTPSHNPWEYGGYNLVTDEATIAPAHITKKIGNLMEKMAQGENINTKVSPDKGKITRINPLKIYNKFINQNVGFDWAAIKKAKVPVIYEDLKGAGKTCFPQFLKKNGVKLEQHLSSASEGPNPVDKNLTALKQAVENHKSPLAMGLANDGDADRFGVIYKDKKGKAQFMNPNDVILLIEHHMFQNRGLSQKPNTVVIKNHATSPEIDALAKKHGAETVQTPVGFKYIAEDFVEFEKQGKKVAVAGEESAGLTVNGDIPEKDGLVALTMLTELVSKEKKPLGQILTDVKANLGVHYQTKLTNFEFASDQQKNATVGFFDKYLKGEGKEFAGFKVDTKKTQSHNEAILKYKPSGDGTKLFLEGGSEVLLRKSGTEPIVRAYVNAAGKDPQEASKNYETLNSAMLKIAGDNGGKVH
jgi:phosphomannomutase